jgi:hypothetical protein
LRIVGVFFAILIVVIAIGAGRGVLPNFEKRVAALQAAGQPVAPSDLPASRPLSIEHQAQLTALIQAMDRLSNNTIPLVSGFSLGSGSIAETAGLRKEISQLLRFDAVVQRVSQPATTSGGVGVKVASMERATLLHLVDSFFTIASSDALQRGGVDDALGCLTNAIRLRTLPESLAGVRFLPLEAGNYSRVLVRLLDSQKLQSAHLEQLHQAYHAFEAAPLLRNQLIAERIQYVQDTRALAASDFSKFSTVPGFQVAAVRHWLWFRVRLQMGFLDTAGCAVLDEYGAQLADLDRIGDPALLRESTQRQTRFSSLPQQVRNLCFSPRSPLDLNALLPKTHARLGLIAIAVARYRLDHAGEFPSSPAELVPRYLSALPVDPYSGGPPEFGPNFPGVAIGFDRSGLTGPDAIPPTTPGGSSARLRLEK